MAVLPRLLLALLALLPAAAGAQPLGTGVPARDGPNRLPPRPLRWHTLATADLDVFFPAGADSLAADAAAVAAHLLPGFEALVGARLPERLPVLVYPAPRAFAASVPLRLGRDAATLDGLADHARGRLVLAFDGDRRRFRQTLAHELLHALLRRRYGDAGLRALLPLRRRAVFPAWMEEGLAEYVAVGYDPPSDHLVRAAVAHGTLPPLDRLGGALAYKGGQNFFHYLAQEFGPEKIAELLDVAALTQDGEAALQQVTGLPLDALSRRWQHALDDAVLPEVAVRERLDERARAVALAPDAFPSSLAFSPDGSRLAFVVDDERGTRLVLLDTAEPAAAPATALTAGPGQPLDRLYAGGTVAWSPNGQRVAVAAAEPTRDVVVTVDVPSGRQTVVPVPGIDRLTGLSWHPDGSLLALAGVRRGQSDLAVLRLATGEVQFLTDDPHTDASPVWLGPSALAFASDRGDALGRSGGRLPRADAALSLDLYRLDVERPTVARLTALPGDERPVAAVSPAGLVFASDANGLVNLYQRSAEGQVLALTDLYVGLDEAALSPDGLRVAYLAPGRTGAPRLWIGRQPLVLARDPAGLAPTAFARVDRAALPLAARLSTDERRARSPFLRPLAPAPPLPDALDAPPGPPATAQRYRLRYALDALGATAAVDPLYGVQALVQVRASDVLGRHRIRVASNLLLDLRASDYEASYAYQPFRRTYTARFFHTARLSVDARTALAQQRYRHYGVTAGAAWPVTPYDRFDADVTLSTVTARAVLDPRLPTLARTALVPRLAYVRDIALPDDAAVPRRGSRLTAAVFGAPRPLRGAGRGFAAATLDARAYLPLPSRASAALRVHAATGVGTGAPRLFTAGQSGWLAPVRDTSRTPVRSIDDVAFATAVAPLRGFPVAHRTGRHAVTASGEVRFPLGVLLLPAPRAAPGLVRLSGTLFADAGLLWGDAGDTLRLVAHGRLDDLLVSVGGGVRTTAAGLPLRLDIAFPFDGVALRTPRALVSVGVDF